ncbi:MAG: PaaI family thioesterase [Microthrixaceae bacterium]
MTDLPGDFMAVTSRLGASAHLEDGEFTIRLLPQTGTLHLGVVRASVISFAVDVVAGILIDRDPDAWAFTTDMSIRMRPVPAADRLVARNTILREGRRSVTCSVSVTSITDGAEVASGALGFARVPRKADDPPKITLTPEHAPAHFTEFAGLGGPLREEAGIEVLDAASGVVQMAVTPSVVNPAGTLQGAMVALLAEAAAEEFVAARIGGPVIVTDLDLRYLGKALVGPVRSRVQALGDEPDAGVRVELVDTSTDTITTLVYARAVRLRPARSTHDVDPGPWSGP